MGTIPRSFERAAAVKEGQMNSRDISIRSLNWMKLVPTVLVAGLSLAACAADPRSSSAFTDIDPNDPSGQACENQGFNCGVITDSQGDRANCGTCAGTNNQCINNRCQRNCTGNNECGGNTRCVRGSCQATDNYSNYGGNRCTDSRDCQAGQYCTNGVCQQNGQGQQCRYSTDCQNGQACVSGYCNNSGYQTSCYSNSDCAYGQQCVGGYCNGSGQQESCTYTTDCPYGQTCNNGWCSGGYSQPGTQQCRYSSECPYGQSCNNGYCQGQGGSGQQCRYNSDCPNNQTCNGGYCSGGYSYGNLRAQCVTSGISFFGFIDVFSEQVLYSPQFPSGIRVDSCICSNGVLRAQIDSYGGYADTYCSRCVKSGDQRYCYQ